MHLVFWIKYEFPLRNKFHFQSICFDIYLSTLLYRKGKHYTLNVYPTKLRLLRFLLHLKSPNSSSYHLSFKVITVIRSEEHTSELQSRGHLVCCLLLEKKKQSRKK